MEFPARGSPLQNYNKTLPGHAQKMNAHLRLWNRLYDNFLIVAQCVVRKGGYLALEWPLRCRYWRHRKVRKLLSGSAIKWGQYEGQSLRTRTSDPEGRSRRQGVDEGLEGCIQLAVSQVLPGTALPGGDTSIL